MAWEELSRHMACSGIFGGGNNVGPYHAFCPCALRSTSANGTWLREPKSWCEESLARVTWGEVMPHRKRASERGSAKSS